MNALRLKSVNSNTELIFSDVQGDYFHVRVEAVDHCASRRVYAYTDGSLLIQLFSDAAEHWRGWSGAKVWESLEGELRLELTADRLGHVTLKICVHEDFGGPDPWRHEAQITLEAGQLDAIAKQANRFFGRGG